MASRGNILVTRTVVMIDTTIIPAKTGVAESTETNPRGETIARKGTQESQGGDQLQTTEAKRGGTTSIRSNTAAAMRIDVVATHRRETKIDTVGIKRRGTKVERATEGSAGDGQSNPGTNANGMMIGTAMLMPEGTSQISGSEVLLATTGGTIKGKGDKDS